MRENLNQIKFVLKGKIDSIEDDMTINVIGGTSKNPLTGAMITVPNKTVPKAKLNKVVKDLTVVE